MFYELSQDHFLQFTHLSKVGNQDKYRTGLNQHFFQVAYKTKP